MIEQAPRRCDQNFAPFAKRFLLGTDIDAAEHHGRAQRRELAVALDAFGHLVRELARGREDQHTHRVPRGRRTGIGHRHQAMQDRQGKGRSLARAGLGRTHYIPALHDERDRLRLDRRRYRIARIDHCLQQQRMQSDLGERGRTGRGTFGSLIV